MLTQSYSPFFDYENELIKKLKKNIVGEDSHSAKVYSQIVEAINTDLNRNALSRELVVRTRMAIKLNPYAPDSFELIRIHNQIMQRILPSKILPLLQEIKKCQDLALPVPVIVSCARYLDKARELQRNFATRYFGITPLIVRGSMDIQEETYDAGVLTLPVNDTYEALPVKILEIAVFLQAFTDNVGFIKIDDDVTVISHDKQNHEEIRDVFKAADYMGHVVNRSYQDRTWHVGKCTSTVPMIYGKPFKTVWPRGAFYYLSHFAMDKLAQHYMRFPGCADGEFYEDKLVGDIMYDNQIFVVPYVLEYLFGVESSSPERLIG